MIALQRVSLQNGLTLFLYTKTDGNDLLQFNPICSAYFFSD